MTPERELREALETVEDLRMDVAMLDQYRLWNAQFCTELDKLRPKIKELEEYVLRLKFELRVSDPEGELGNLTDDELQARLE